MRALQGLAVLGIAGCAYLLPAAYAVTDAEPEDAAFVITRAMDEHGLSVSTEQPKPNALHTRWNTYSDGPTRVRERFRVWWERTNPDNRLMVHVRHEHQSLNDNGGTSDWGGTKHDRNEENVLLKRIIAAFAARESSNRGDDPVPDGTP